eukprot:1990727-Pyramimonas_sp.AAC.1
MIFITYTYMMGSNDNASLAWHLNDLAFVLAVSRLLRNTFAKLRPLVPPRGNDHSPTYSCNFAAQMSDTPSLLHATRKRNV